MHFVLPPPIFGLYSSSAVSEIDVTRCKILRPKCTEFDFLWGSDPDSSEGAYSAPPDDPLALWGLHPRGGEGKGMGKMEGLG